MDFEAERLQAEIGRLDESAWRPHPQGHRGNTALPLIALYGDPLDDGVAGPMLPTPHLERSPYLQQVLASFDTVLGRARLMRIDGHADATKHVDTNYYWAERVRIHVPITTSPEIVFTCGDAAMHMAPGEAWIFDAWRPHNVVNPTGAARIHLVADTVGSDAFWRLVDLDAEPRAVPYRPGAPVRLQTERQNFPVVMTPWEQTELARGIFADLAADASPTDVQRLGGIVTALRRAWRVSWARFGAEPTGWPVFERLRDQADAALDELAGRLRLNNGTDAVEIVRQLLLRPALNPQLAGGGPPAPRPAPRVRVSGDRRAGGTRPYRFHRPVLIVAPPRSGTSLLFETLARSPDAWTIGGESHLVVESVAALHPAQRGWDSNRLGALDARPAVIDAVRAGFAERLRNRAGAEPPPGSTGLRLLEKTPKNALRVPFLDAVFPDAVFVYVHRDPREAIASMIEGWESGGFVTYPQLPGWEGPPWSFLLTPQWRELAGASVAEIAAHQWETATRLLLDDLERLAPERWAVADHQALVDDPAREVERLCAFAGLDWDEDVIVQLPLAAHTVSAPAPDKWRAHEREIALLLDGLQATATRAAGWLADPPQTRAAPPARPALRGVATSNLAELLADVGASLAISTYGANRLAVVRAAGEGINTHFRTLDAPMGIARDGDRLAVGTRAGVLEYRNVPAVAARLDDALGVHDACFIPRHKHVTGDVRVHDLAFAGGELWLVATRFGALATLDADHSFVPRWQPPFVSALAADDRCHLNGLAVVDDRPRFVTALGADDRPGGWRERRADGGVLLDVDSGETIVAGLSMPHSPRWHDGRLWLLESGQGTLCAVDLAAGRVEAVVELPGFTRGLAFAGRYAFVGLSQVREATTFGGLPLTARLEDRQSGVWVVDLRRGQVAAFLRFEDAVQEIFDVVVLDGLRFPEVTEMDSDATNGSFVLPDAALA
jgi:uncharacterized protein (TIGR03032 family)